MKRLAGNVASAVFGSIVGVLLVLVAIDGLSALFNELEDVKGNYTYLNALGYVAMTLPSRIYEFIPFASLIGCLIGLGALASNSELVVMRSAGVSLGRIVWFVMRPVFLVIFAGVLLAEYVVPYSDQYAAAFKALRSDRTQVQDSAIDLWNKEGNEFMHFNVVAPGGVLYGVARYQFDENRQITEASFSRRATFFGDYWQEEEVMITRFAEDHTATDEQLLRRWDTELSPSLLNLIAASEESLSIGGLHRYARYLEEQGQSAARYWLAFWQKALQPISVLGLVLVAISFIFGPLRQVTVGFRVFSGVVVGIAFWISQEMLGPSSLVFGFSPVISVLVPVVICLLVGTILLRRAA